MTVRELIQMLNNQPPDKEVIVGCDGWRADPRIVESPFKGSTFENMIFIEGLGRVIYEPKKKSLQHPEFDPRDEDIDFVEPDDMDRERDRDDRVFRDELVMPLAQWDNIPVPNGNGEVGGAGAGNIGGIEALRIPQEFANPNQVIGANEVRQANRAWRQMIFNPRRG